MKLVACMLARNGDWVIGLSARVALMWCDELVVVDHASTDRTRQILIEVRDEHGFPDRVHYLSDCQPRWDEMNQRQEMLEVAREHGATHCAIVDADEILTGNV